MTRIRRLNLLMTVLVLLGAFASNTAGAASSSTSSSGENEILVKAACSLTKDELMRINRE